jgi:protein-S-isoprenylcysteine O-methyltransferase Ste14
MLRGRAIKPEPVDIPIRLRDVVDAVLGHAYRPQPGHELVTDGVYRIIRHPSYLGMLILMFGWALAFRSGAGVILAALIIPPILARIRSEEALLCAQFGKQYEAYCRRTSRLIPGIY